MQADSNPLNARHCGAGKVTTMVTGWLLVAALAGTASTRALAADETGPVMPPGQLVEPPREPGFEAPQDDASADADAEQDEAPPLRVENLGDGWFKLGDIRFHRHTGEIVFPAEINQQEDILEYLIVQETGKTHESLLRTAISPTHLQAVLLLLRYPMSRDELENLMRRPSADPDAIPWVPPQPTEEEMERFHASRVHFYIRPKPEDDGEEPEDIPIFDWVLYTENTEAGPDDFLMVFNGSAEVPAGFSAELSGSIAANYFDRGAMFNLIHDDAWLDTVWFPMPEIVPNIGTPVDVVIRKPTPADGDGGAEARAEAPAAGD